MDGKLSDILETYRTRGLSRYDEVVTQLEHALQCATLAMTAACSDELVSACLLHDIGHLVSAPRPDRSSRTARDLEHERIGSRLLERLFPRSVTEPIRLHVAAKRVLCTLDPAYREGLSPASIASLALQGGLMTEVERVRFEEAEHADAALSPASLRRPGQGTGAKDSRTRRVRTDPGSRTPQLIGCLSSFQ